MNSSGCSSGRADAIALVFIMFFISFLVPQFAEAKTKIIVLEDGTKAYSGPGSFYRPLAVLKGKTELIAANATVRTRDGEFFRVVIKLSEKKNAIGFVNVTQARPLGSLDADDLEKYGEVALVNKGLQVSYAQLRDQVTFWSFGYMHYLSPGFYVKGYAGQIHAPNAAGGVFAGELGNDALLIGRLSGVVSYAAGIFNPEQSGTFFDGSSAFNGFVQASVGLRYNMGGLASVSAAATQAALFNANNSYVTYGGLLSLEVGL
jgi:hypothetical protein